MVLRVLVTAAAAALLVWKGDSSSSSAVDAGPRTVVALAGEDVILPCSFDVSTDEFPTVEWSKEDLSPDVVLLHRDGCEIQEMKNVLYEYRTSLVLRELRNGNVSLRLAALRHSDRGRYRCKTLWREGPDHVSEVELIVAAVAMPTLTLTAVGRDGVTVLCDSGCWTPRPLLELLDDDEELIHPQALEEERRSLTGCYRVQMKAELQSATRSVTCKVQQREFNHSRRTTIILPDLCLFNHQTVGVAVGLTVMCCFLFFVLLESLRKIWKNHKKMKMKMKMKPSLQDQSSNDTSVSFDNEVQTLISSQDQPDDIDGGGANRRCNRVLERQESDFQSDASSSSSPVSANGCCQSFANTPLNKHHPPPLTRQTSFSTADLSASSSISSEAPPVATSLTRSTHGGVQSSNPPLNKPQNGVAEPTDKARKPEPQKQKVTAAAPAVPVLTPAARSLTRPTHNGVQSSPPPLNNPQNGVAEPTGKARTPEPQRQKVAAVAPATAPAPASAVASRHIDRKPRNNSCPILLPLNLRSNQTNRHVNPEVRRISLQANPQQSSNRYSTLANLPDSH